MAKDGEQIRANGLCSTNREQVESPVYNSILSEDLLIAAHSLQFIDHRRRFLVIRSGSGYESQRMYHSRSNFVTLVNFLLE